MQSININMKNLSRNTCSIKTTSQPHYKRWKHFLLCEMEYSFYIMSGVLCLGDGFFRGSLLTRMPSMVSVSTSQCASQPPGFSPVAVLMCSSSSPQDFCCRDGQRGQSNPDYTFDAICEKHIISLSASFICHL